MTEGQIKQLDKKYKELKEENKELKIKIDRLESDCDAYNYSQGTYQDEIKELKKQIEKLLGWISENGYCCDFCPMTDTCRNDEGTCPYANDLQKDETKTTKEWARQKLLKE